MKLASWLLPRIILAGSFSMPVAAQEARPLSPLNLPRPGYESHPIRLGPVTVQPDLTVTETYDSNVFATPQDVEHDFVTVVTPTAQVSATHGKLDLNGKVSVTATEFADHEKESSVTLATAADARYSIDRANQVGASVNYARLTESRADPEATRGNDESPARYDTYGAGVSYAYRRNRLGIAAGSSVQHVSYADGDEADRDRNDYRGSLRGSLAVTPRFNAFLETYVELRDFVDDVDRSGLDRDATTLGFYLGTTIAIADKWSGEIGVGLFRTDNEDSSLTDFTGVGARGALTWSVTPRTAVTAALERQDTPTVSPGASGLIETRASLRLEQEIRHDFVASAEVGLLRYDYQERNRQLTGVSGQVTAEYLLNRHVSALFSVGYTDRTGDIDDDEYERVAVSAGLRFKL